MVVGGRGDVGPDLYLNGQTFFPPLLDGPVLPRSFIGPGMPFDTSIAPTFILGGCKKRSSRYITDELVVLYTGAFL